MGLSGAREAVVMPGASGMVRMQYTGRMQLFTLSGQTSRTNYRFGATRRIGWVDQRDVGKRGESGFLNVMEAGEYVFEPYREPGQAQAPPALATPPVPAPSPAPVGEEQPDPGLDAQASMAEMPDPANLTVPEIRALDLTPAQWRRLLDLEQAGKQRTTAIQHIETALANA